MATMKRGGKRGNNSQSEEEDVEMKPAQGSPVKINYELYNEEFGEGSSGKSVLLLNVQRRRT
jgi:hypothetical protein